MRSTATPATSARRDLQVVGEQRGPGSPTPGRRPRRASAPCSSRTGRTWAAIAAPTASSQRPNTPPTSARPAPPRSERSTPSSASVTGTGSSLASRRPRRPTPTARPRRRPRRRRSRSDPLRRSPPAGTAPAVVITTWPGGRWREQRGGPAGVELGQHVVEHEHRGRPGPLGDQAVGAEAQGQRQRALLALRRVGARRQPVDRQHQLVAVRADGRHAAAHVGVAGRGQRRGQPDAPPRRVVRQRRPRSAGRPAGRRPRRRAARSASTSVAAGVAEPLAGLGQLGVPHVERAPSSSRRVGRRPGAAACCAGARCGRARGERRRTSRPGRRACRRGSAGGRPGPPLTSVRSSGENTVTRTTPSRSRARAEALAVDLHPVAPGRHELGLDQRRAARRRRAPRPARSPRWRRRAPAPRAARRGSWPASPGRPAPRRGSSCPGRCRRRRPSCRRSSANDAVRVVAEVDELEPLDDHGRLRRLGDQGTRTGISRYR